MSLHLAQQGDRLALVGDEPGGPVLVVDFVEGAAADRQRIGRGLPLARAVGVRGGALPTVLDATAGLGRDAFLLAALGCEVHLVERSEPVAALLADGLARARAHPATAEAAARMNLSVGEAVEVMAALPAAARPDVVYLDPMFPASSKSALPKLEMQLLRAALGPDPDVERLLEAALRCARRRVVLKRPRKGPTVPGPKPHSRVEGRAARYDLYAPRTT